VIRSNLFNNRRSARTNPSRR